MLVIKKEYLGDSVYVCPGHFEGVILTTENGIEATNTIYLEPRVIKSLETYLAAWKEEFYRGL